ncbi:MAG: hypothetical protein AB9915_00325 [Candidatus Dojkabacteria bacterium]
MDESDILGSQSENTDETLRQDGELEIEPQKDNQLEEPLRIFEELASKYEKEDQGSGNYQLKPEDEQKFVRAYHNLKGVLTERASDYKKTVISFSLYPQGFKGKACKFVDKLLDQQGFRKDERLRMVNEELISNPYKTAIKYIEATVWILLKNKQIQSEGLRIVVNGLRGFDRVAKENLNRYRSSLVDNTKEHGT